MHSSNVDVYIKSYGTGQSLVFFHGWGVDHQIWTTLLAELTTQYNVFLVDLPGFGRTPRMEWQAFKTNLLNQLPSTFAIVGWSMGGLFATRLVLEVPNRVTHLLNLASSPYFIRETGWPGIEPRVLTSFYKRLQRNPQKTRQDFIQLQLQSHEQFSDFDWEAFATCSGLKSGLDVLLYWDFRNELKSLSLPVAYFSGQLDSIMPVSTIQVMKTLYPSFKYVVFLKSAHVPFLSEPDLFLKRLKDFLQ